jgi:hypothetical protein
MIVQKATLARVMVAFFCFHFQSDKNLPVQLNNLG